MPQVSVGTSDDRVPRVGSRRFASSPGAVRPRHPRRPPALDEGGRRAGAQRFSLHPARPAAGLAHRSPSTSRWRSTPATVAEMIHEFIGALDLQRRDARRQRHRRRPVPAARRRPPRRRRPAGADQLRRLREVPAVPVHRGVRDDSRAQDDPADVRPDEGPPRCGGHRWASGCCCTPATMR